MMSDVQFIDSVSKKHQKFREEISKVIFGQQDVIETITWAIYSGGHALLIGVPGLAKTMIVKTVASVLGLDFSRIQFTPDLMPSDILGSEILNKDRRFEFIKGPIFSNIVLADEINRTPPKTQSALLEAMQERQITIGRDRYELDSPYFVLATQNPIEQEGTYPLPEAQLDRFMFAIDLKYPSIEEEMEIVKATTNDKEVRVNPIFTAEEILQIQHLVRRIPVTDNLVKYTVELVHRTRPESNTVTDFIKNYVDYGAGPRASQTLILAAKTYALISGKYAPDIDDVKKVAIPTLKHRIIKNYKAEAEDISIEQIINTIL